MRTAMDKVLRIRRSREARSDGRGMMAVVYKSSFAVKLDISTRGVQQPENRSRRPSISESMILVNEWFSISCEFELSQDLIDAQLICKLLRYRMRAEQLLYES